MLCTAADSAEPLLPSRLFLWGFAEAMKRTDRFLLSCADPTEIAETCAKSVPNLLLMFEVTILVGGCAS